MPRFEGFETGASAPKISGGMWSGLMPRFEGFETIDGSGDPPEQVRPD